MLDTVTETRLWTPRKRNGLPISNCSAPPVTLPYVEKIHTRGPYFLPVLVLMNPSHKSESPYDI